jgi:hypothetical protein
MGVAIYAAPRFEKEHLTNAISISFGLLIALFAILLLYWIRKLQPQVAGY